MIFVEIMQFILLYNYHYEKCQARKSYGADYMTRFRESFQIRWAM